MDWTTQKPLSRVQEGVHVIRTLLDDGAITFDGEFFTYKGLFTFARPVQEHLPVKMGALRGPKSFQVAAEFSDGCHHALSYTRGAYEYMYENVKIGAEKAGRNVDDLDIGAWVVFATGKDSTIAKDAARSMVGLSIGGRRTAPSRSTASSRAWTSRCGPPPEARRRPLRGSRSQPRTPMIDSHRLRAPNGCGH